MAMDVPQFQARPPLSMGWFTCSGLYALTLLATVESKGALDFCLQKEVFQYECQQLEKTRLTSSFGLKPRDSLELHMQLEAEDIPHGCLLVYVSPKLAESMLSKDILGFMFLRRLLRLVQPLIFGRRKTTMSQEGFLYIYALYLRPKTVALRRGW